MESLWLLPFFLGIFFIILPQVFQFYFQYNPYENLGVIAFKFWFITVKTFSFEVKCDRIILRTNKKRIDMLFLEFDPKLKFYQKLSNEIKDKVKLKYLDIYSRIGTTDASSTALMTGALAVLAKAICSKIKNSKPTATININAFAEFKKKVFEVLVYSKISLSIFDFLYAVVIAWLGQKQNT